MKNYPKIGIRPTIDGRQGGVRESLEEKTMAMAHAAKELIERSLRYADGTQRPGAVYLAAAMAGYAQKGLPAFKIYGHDVQDLEDHSIPTDVAEKILSFARGAFAVGQMKGKSYVNIGSSCMGIAGSQVDDSFFGKYLGMPVEYVDMTEILRRMTLGIYDEAEYKKAYTWIQEKC